ncbi:PTS system, mannose-specific IIB component [Paucidesulfovibrio gracilis DSM 16080]|uniref:PTS system, mannose-specific IIB component n=1 Tax=Paucidesulfovibrio gracilis DSM 16080 TaxID=1121449 RepID=A0A1T4WM15_9BACT|nr:PTS sugar transporter subunit IIB [Paucidesulfovibrio gracilis]SKA78386.1 PTS system, mannose-specific IIB component [Paucidesulfovibrio gracilis DSM 16080]
MNWVRVDNRLVHGQVVETWLPYVGAKGIIVANDDVSDDPLTQEIMSLAIPQSMSTSFVSINDLLHLQEIALWSSAQGAALVLFSNCEDARRAYEIGFRFQSINIGNIHYAPGKRQLSPSVAVNDSEEECLRFFADREVKLDFRCVPNDPVQVRF